MFVQPMETTINQGIKQDTTIEQLKRHIIQMRNDGENQFLVLQEHVHDDYFILGLGAGPYIDPKPWVHPIQITIDEDTYVVIDMRACTRYDRAKGEPVVSNASLYRRDLILTLLQTVWMDEGPNSILRLGNYQITVFATWLSGLISRRFALDAGQQLKLSIVSAYYYLCLFNEKGRMDASRTATLIGKALNVNVAYVLEVVGDLPFISDILEYLDAVDNTLSTERIAGLTPDLLVALLSGSWFGPNHSVLVGVAIEYPPVFCSLLYLSLTDRSTKMSGIAKVALLKERDPIAKEFVRITSDTLKTESSEF